MADDPLHEILHLEEELRRRLASEEARLLARRQALELELAEAEASRLEILAAEREQALARARQEADQEAMAMLAAARQYAARLDAFSDEELRAALRRCLPRLLSGDRHDHPHDQD
jgi:aminopeptidase N